jgi:integrase
LVGRAHIGWRRWPGKRGEPGGQWLLRRYIGKKYRVATLGLADDVQEADGERVFDFNQASTNANARLNVSKGKVANLTVRAAIDNYVAFKRSEGQPTSDLQSRAAAHILPALGDELVAELTREEIRNWLANLAAAPAMVRSGAGKPLRFKAEPSDAEAVRRRRSSANRTLTALKAALNHAFDEGHVTNRDAWGRAVKPFKGVDAARVRYLKVADAKRLINSCNPDFRPLVQAALETGARYGELGRLEVADFNPDVATVAIRKSKTSTARHIQLTEQGAAFFRQVTAGRPGSELIFRKGDGTPWGKSHQSRPMEEACVRAKIEPPIGIHGLRHTWASLAVMNGVPLLVVATNMGHKDTRMVEKFYGHLAPSHIADEIRAKAPKFGFKPDPKIKTL